ncbi:MAG: hypothetical protein C4574_03165 [Candidatus Latescibacterota bacterium]|nr:MAG: hypothetical protein C4574_03165 [Candidatus Latescibacterota bacterium]
MRLLEVRMTRAAPGAHATGSNAPFDDGRKGRFFVVAGAARGFGRGGAPGRAAAETEDRS